jgi:hypothetical protein
VELVEVIVPVASGVILVRVVIHVKDVTVNVRFVKPVVKVVIVVMDV